jgi:hypothetical protein
MNDPRGVAASAVHRWLLAAAAACIALHGLIAPGWAQDEQAAETAQLLTPEELRVVVAPIAFYPDDVLAVVLPASTTGLQLVEAQRFLEKRKSDSSLQPKEEWDPSVIALLNYPDVVDRLNADLDWTQKLGDAVLDQQADVLDAIQQARTEAVAAGYLKSDDKQVITQEKETVVIQSANPETVYVPTYDPQVVVQQTYTSYPPPTYYPPAPPYYAPAATFFAGALTGAAFAYAFDWNDNDININYGDNCCRGGNVNIGNDVNIGSGNRAQNIDSTRFNADRQNVNGGDKLKWNGNKQRQKRETAAGQRRNPSAAPLGQGGAGANKKTLGAGGAAKARPGDQAGARAKPGGLGDPQAGRQTVKQSKRGNQSMQGTQNRPSAGAQKQQRTGGAGAGAAPRQRQGAAGAFGGAGGGGKAAGAQSRRGNQSMQGLPKRRR